MRAYVLLNTKPGTSEEVLKNIEAAGKVKGILLADSVYGRFDALVVLEADTLEDVSRIIYEVIERIPNIVHTETLVSLFSKK